MFPESNTPGFAAMESGGRVWERSVLFAVTKHLGGTY